MLKKFALQITLVVALSFLGLSCNKESITENADFEVVNAAANPANAAFCHLTRYELSDPANNYFQIDEYAYKDGKVDEWSFSWGWRIKMEYGKAGKMQKARIYEGNDHVYTIQFIYQNNRVIREIWYLAETNVIDDEVVLEYNQQGLLIKNESLNYSYFCIYEYFPSGEVKSWFYYSDGLPKTLGEYTYHESVKNAVKYASGIDYQFAYINSGFFAGPHWYSSEKITQYDDAGNPSIYYEQDAALTKWTVGKGNFPILAEYTDKHTNNKITNSFEYLNCSDPLANRSAALKAGSQTSNKLNGKFMKKISGVPGKGIMLR